ncbi:ROK family protein [Oceanimonas sp. NS1]|nr:ROK family protein [Oceanimonas sp. NS1]
MFIGNDIRAQALAEHYYGASQDCLDSVLVSVHHGVGAGIITEGRIFKSQGRDVAEIGHIHVDPLGERCDCGTFGCLETMVADAALLRQARHMLDQGYHSSLAEQELTMGALCRRAALEQDRLAVNILCQAAERLGQVMAIVINLFNPQRVLLSGALCEAESLVFPIINKAIRHQSLPGFHQGQVLIRARFQDDQTIGGLALVKRGLLEGELLQRIMEQSREQYRFQHRSRLATAAGPRPGRPRPVSQRRCGAPAPETKGRKGAGVICVYGIGPERVGEVAKKLKKQLGTGGAVKKG